MLCVLSNTTQAADNNKVLPEENIEWFEIFSKIANFLSFYERNQTRTVTSFYPKSPFADNLGKLWLQLPELSSTFDFHQNL